MIAADARYDRARSRAGFTLIELSTALFILVIGLFGAFNLYYFGLAKLRTLDEAAIAERALQNEIEALRAARFAAITPGERPFAALPPELDQLHLAETRTAIAPAPDGPAGLLHVDLSIRWVTENGRRAERSVTTLIAETAP